MNLLFTIITFISCSMAAEASASAWPVPNNNHELIVGAIYDETEQKFNSENKQLLGFLSYETGLSNNYSVGIKPMFKRQQHYQLNDNSISYYKEISYITNIFFKYKLYEASGLILSLEPAIDLKQKYYLSFNQGYTTTNFLIPFWQESKFTYSKNTEQLNYNSFNLLIALGIQLSENSTLILKNDSSLQDKFIYSNNDWKKHMQFKNKVYISFMYEIMHDILSDTGIYKDVYLTNKNDFRNSGFFSNLIFKF